MLNHLHLPLVRGGGRGGGEIGGRAVQGGAWATPESSRSYCPSCAPK